MKGTFSANPADLLKSIKPSGIRKMFARAQGLEGVISLGIGAPDLSPPQELLDALTANFSNHLAHSYTLNSGITQLREKIVERYKNIYNLDYSKEGVVVGVGATELMYGAFFAYLNPGDEVIVPDPGFVYYPIIPAMAGAKVIMHSLDDNFQIDIERLNETINPKTKMMVINTPGNPTGRVLNHESLKAIADIAIDNNIIIFSDEVYEFLTYDGIKHKSMAEYAPNNTIILNSFSKTYCIPGWRLGFALSTDELIKPLGKIHPFIVANPPSLWQYAINDFIGTKAEQQFIQNMHSTMSKRRDVVEREFSKIPGVEVPKVNGSFYAFPKIVSELYRSENPGYQFVEDIFTNAHVVLVPGSEFGDSRPDHFRISFGSANEDSIRESVQRIIEYIDTK